MTRGLEIREWTKVNCFIGVFCYLCCLVTSQTVQSLSFGTVNQAVIMPAVSNSTAGHATADTYKYFPLSYINPNPTKNNS